MNPKLQQLMRDTVQLTRTGRLQEATDSIQRVLSGFRAPLPAPTAEAANERRGAGVADEVIDVEAVVIDTRHDIGHDIERDADAGQASFITGMHSDAGLTRDYKLYIPPQHAAGRKLPLIVMLHGCTQNPDDFAAGTAMNELAHEKGCYVLYPAQSADANPQRCWNWFKHSHQGRERGEPALLAGMTRAVMAEHGIDARRVYIAGLSAGGAMAAIVAQAYPELYAAVGVHSGLPVGAARDLMSALSAMKDGPAAAVMPAEKPVPTIVFHGDGDATVNPRNGEQVLAASLAGTPNEAQREQGVTAQGRHYTRTRHTGRDGRVIAEQWTVHGGPHAWSGGRGAGSHTDPAGPDASREMLRFFLDQANG